MTWEYYINTKKEQMEVYDHNGIMVGTVKKENSGYRIPQDITDIMRQEADKARSNANMERWRDIHIRLADNDIAPKE